VRERGGSGVRNSRELVGFKKSGDLKKVCRRQEDIEVCVLWRRWSRRERERYKKKGDT